MKRRHVNVPYVLLDLEESNETKYVFIAILSFRSNNNKKIKVSLNKISEVTGLKFRQLTNHVNRLIQQKMISRSQVKHSNGDYSCNTYTILCDEKYFAEIPYEIACDKLLSVSEKIGYCIMKRYINLAKIDFATYLTKNDLASYLGCSLNQVDKIKRSLKKAGLVEFERNSNMIVLVYECSQSDKTKIKKSVRKNNRVSQNENHSTNV